MPNNHLPDSSEGFTKALQDLKETLDREAAQPVGPSNQDIYNCIISLRDDYDPQSMTARQSAYTIRIQSRGPSSPAFNRGD